MPMTTVPSSPPPLAGDPVSGPSVPARLRIVAWMLFVVAQMCIRDSCYFLQGKR